MREEARFEAARLTPAALVRLGRNLRPQFEPRIDEATTERFRAAVERLARALAESK